MGRKFKQTKKFGKHHLELNSGHETKKRANEVKQKLKKEGFKHVRVIRNKKFNGYDVYKSKS